MTKLTFDEYQREAMATAIYPREYAVVYPALGLMGESGEICEKVKKAIRDHAGAIDWEAITNEIGDCLWYCAALASDFNLSISEILRADTFDEYDERQSGLRLIDSAHTKDILIPSLSLAVNAASTARYATTWQFLVKTDEYCNDRLRDHLSSTINSLFYLAGKLVFTPEQIARANLAKLADRQARGVLGGEGDER